jgi:IS6 family transposase
LRWLRSASHPRIADTHGDPRVHAARPCGHAVANRWHLDETDLKVGGSWRYLYRAVDQFGQVVDVLLSTEQDARAARRFFTRDIATSQSEPAEVVTDRARAYLGLLNELLPGALHDFEPYANNVLEADHGRLKARLRPMGGLKTRISAQLVSSGHAFMQDLRRGHYELAVDASPKRRLAHAFAELALVI